MKNSRYYLLVVLIAPLLVLSGCATNPVTGKSELHMVSQDQEIDIGKKVYPDMIQMEGGPFGAVPGLQSYVSRVGLRLARYSARKNLPYQFTVLNNLTPNAWALPGGKIAINIGLLVHLDSEAELAAVLAHEIIHADARHTAQRLERAQMMNVGMLIASQFTPASVLTDQVAALGMQLIHQNYSRGAESEADYYGMKIMSEAGYNPEAAVELQQTFVELSKEHKSDWLSGLFASHPPSEDRVDANRETVHELKKGGVWGREFYKKKIALLIKWKPAFELYKKTIKEYHNKDYRKALGYINQAIAKAPRLSILYSTRGALNEKTDEDKYALADYNKAISLNNNYFMYFLQKGLLLKKLGRNSDARSALCSSQALLKTKAAQDALRGQPKC